MAWFCYLFHCSLGAVSCKPFFQVPHLRRHWIHQVDLHASLWLLPLPILLELSLFSPLGRRFHIVNPVRLLIPQDHKSCLVLFNASVWFEFSFEYPFAPYHLSIRWKLCHCPRFVLLQGIQFSIHCLNPVFMLHSLMKIQWIKLWHNRCQKIAELWAYQLWSDCMGTHCLATIWGHKIFQPNRWLWRSCGPSWRFSLCFFTLIVLYFCIIMLSFLI